MYCWLLVLLDLDFGFMTDSRVVESLLHEIFIAFPLLYIAFELKPNRFRPLYNFLFSPLLDIELGNGDRPINSR